MPELNGLGNCEQRSVLHKETEKELNWRPDLAHERADWRKAHALQMNQKVEVNSQNIHVVKWGETLDDLAARWLKEHGQSHKAKDIEAQKKQLISLNQDAYPDLARNRELIKPGWQLRMAPCKPAETAAASPKEKGEPRNPPGGKGAPAGPPKEKTNPTGPQAGGEVPGAPPAELPPATPGGGRTGVPPENPTQGTPPPEKAAPTGPVLPGYSDAYLQALSKCSFPWKTAGEDAAIGAAIGGGIGRFLGWRGKALGTGLGFLAGGIVGFAIGEIRGEHECVAEQLRQLDNQKNQPGK